MVAVQILWYSKFYLPFYVMLGDGIYLAMLRLTNAVKPEDVRLMEEYLGPRFSALVEPFERLIVSS